MEFFRVIKGYDHLWSVKCPNENIDEVTSLFRKWSDGNYLLDFFEKNIEDLEKYFYVNKISLAIKDTLEDASVLERMILHIPESERLDDLFHPLSQDDIRITEMTREKARNWNRSRHASWLRIYAIRLEKGVFVVTGGAIKLTPTMQARPHTKEELIKLNKCRDYLKGNGVFDQDSFIDYLNE